MSGVCCGKGAAEGPEFDSAMHYSGLTPTTKERQQHKREVKLQ